MTSKTKKILLIVCAVLVIAGAIVGIVYDVTPTVDPEVTVDTINVSVDTTLVAEDTCAFVDVADTIATDSIAK